MIGASRPAEKKTNDDINPYLLLHAVRRASVRAPSHLAVLDSVVQNSHRQTSNQSNQLEPDTLPISLIVPEPEILRLNIGGNGYRLKESTVQKRDPEALLAHFAKQPHEQKRAMCDAYFSDTQEYYFERSALLFDQVYLYYLTGKIHKPRHICPDIFMAELLFWNLCNPNFAACCWPQPEKNVPLEMEPPDLESQFKCVAFGNTRKFFWDLIETPESGRLAKAVSMLSILAVLLSNIGLVLQSLPDLQVNYTKTVGNRTVFLYKEPHPFFDYLETTCVVWFSLEYFTKMLVAVERRKVFLELLNIVDLIAIIPFYIELVFTIAGISTAEFEELKGALLVVRIMRVLRVVRLFKLGRYSSGLRVFAKTIQASKEQLSMLIVVLITGTMFFSTLIYYLEKDEVGTDFTSIPAAFWWCIVTMTTVGYGDYVPETIGGKLVATGAIAAGILVLALPITIIVDNFMKVQEDVSTGGGLAMLAHHHHPHDQDSD